MVSFQGARKLSSYLISAKAYPLERKVGSCGCGKKRCQFALILLKCIHLPALLPIRHIRLIICLIALKDV